MAYRSDLEEREAMKALRTGKVSSIPCYSCDTGRICSDPDIPIENQVVFYCDSCKAKIIIN